MPITEQTKDRLAALAQLGSSLSSICTAALEGADSDDPRVDPLMGTVRKIFLATQNLGSQVARITAGSSVVRKNSAQLFAEIGIPLPADLPDVLSFRQFQNAVNQAAPNQSFVNISDAFESID